MNITKYIFLLLILLGCSDKTSEDQSPQQTKPQLSETDLGPLFNYYTPNPQTQQEKDENIIIEFLADQRIDAERIGSGVYMVIEEKGNGPSISRKDRVTTHYEGSILNGKVFDSSYRKNKPLTMGVWQFIQGWQEAIQQLNGGGKGIVFIPSTLGYGKNGYPPVIPPDAILKFEMEVLGVNEELSQ